MVKKTFESNCDENQYHRFEVATCLTIFAETLNSSVNAIVYGMFGEKFRKTFKELFCKKCLKNQEEHRGLESFSMTTYGANQNHQN